MKTINFKLSKRLNELGLLDNIETEYYYNIIDNINLDEIFRDNKKTILVNKKDLKQFFPYIKTLTIEEAIEFLPIFIPNFNCTKSFCMWNGLWVVSYGYQKDLENSPKGETLLEAIEKMIEYLLDNNLIGKTN